MKAIKIIAGIIVLAVIAVALIAYLGIQNLDKLIKTAVEEVGTSVVGAEVRLDGATIDIGQGVARLNGLSIQNPAGYSDAKVFSLGEIGIQLDPTSVTGDVIVIKEVVIDKMKLLAEQKGIKDTNLQALIDNIKKRSGSGAAGTEAGSESSSSGSAIKLAVESFRFSASELTIRSDQFEEQQVELPTIKLANLGSKEQGLSPEELGQAVISRLTQEAKKAAESRMKELAKDKAEENLKAKLQDKLGDKGAEKLEKFKGLIGG